jgi:hypothetical protein
MSEDSYRIVFFVNHIPTPFIWAGLDGIKTFGRASILADFLSKWDLGIAQSDQAEKIHATQMIRSYSAYRRKYSINHHSLIYLSVMTIDKFDGEDWWIISEECDNPEYLLGELRAFDNFTDS